MPTTTPQPELPEMPDWFKGLMSQFKIGAHQAADELYLTCSMPNRCPWIPDVPTDHEGNSTVLDVMELAFAHAVEHMQRHHKNMELLSSMFDIESGSRGDRQV